MKTSITIFLLFVLSILVQSQPSIDPVVNSYIQKNGKVNILAFFGEKANFDLFLLQQNANTLEEGTPETAQKVVEALKEDAKVAQSGTKTELKLEGRRYRSYWIANVLAIDNVDNDELKRLSSRKDIQRIQSNEPAKVEDTKLKKTTVDESVLPFHVKEINAHKLYQKGFFGNGVVMGIDSTGVNVNHEALKPNYRGTQPDGKYIHNYNHYEGLPFVIPEPKDDVNIGTFLAGVSVGSKRNIGVSPQSKFITCKGIDGLGRDAPEYQLKCLQFFLSPVTVNGTDPRPDLRPDIVQMNYCESCTDVNVLRRPIQALIAAGIFVIAPSGGRLPEQNKCSRINKVPSNYPEVFSVSGLGNDNLTLSTSAAGPGFFNGSVTPYIKPNAVCGGDNIVSAVLLENENLYFSASGSSIANAVAAGGAALLLSAVPQLKRRPKLLYHILEKSATRKDSVDCDGNVLKYPNSEYGYGLINLEKAYDLAKNLVSRRCQSCLKKCRVIRCKRTVKRSKQRKEGKNTLGNSPTTKCAPNKSTTRPTQKKVTTTKPTKNVVQPTTKKSTTKPTVKYVTKPTTKKATTKPTVKYVAKPTTKRPTTKSTTKPTVKYVTKPTTKKATTKPTVKQVTKPTTKKSTTKPTVKYVTRPTTKKPTTKSPTTKPTVKYVTKPTSKRPTTKASTTKPTIKYVTKPTSKKPTTRVATTKPTVKYVVKPTTKKPTTRVATTKPTVKYVTKPTSKKPTTKATTKPTVKYVTKPTSKKPTTKKVSTTRPTVKYVTKPTTKKATTKPTVKYVVKPTTKKPTTKSTTRPTVKYVTKPTTKKSTTRPTSKKPTTKASTTKPTVKYVTKPTTKKTTTRPTSNRPTTKATTKPTVKYVTKPTTKKATTKPTKVVSTTKPTVKYVTKPTTKKSTTKPTVKYVTKPTTKRPTTKVPTTKPTVKQVTKPTTKKATTKPTKVVSTTKPTVKYVTKPTTKKSTTKPTKVVSTTKPTVKYVTKPTTKKATTKPTKVVSTTKPTVKYVTKPTSKRPTTKVSTTKPTVKYVTKPTTKKTTTKPTTKTTTKPTSRKPTTRATTRPTTGKPTTKYVVKPTTRRVDRKYKKCLERRRKCFERCKKRVCVGKKCVLCRLKTFTNLESEVEVLKESIKTFGSCFQKSEEQNTEDWVF